MTTKTKEDNGQLTTADALEQQFNQWLSEHQAGIAVFMISPSGIPVPLPDCLDESFKRWQIGIKPINNNGGGNG